MNRRNLSPMSMRELAARCRAEAKEPGIPNRTAILLILASQKLEQSADRHVYQAVALERAEAERG